MMSQSSIVQRTPYPNTRASLKSEFEALGLAAGDVVIVHSSMSSIGWVAGGPEAIVQALMDVLTPSGTLVMPTHSSENSDPKHWQAPPIPEDWWQIVREHMPAFNSATSPTRMMGLIVETFRHFPDVVRSGHPMWSFAAWGRDAAQITSNHRMGIDLGEGSPLSRIYDLDGKILLLGVTHANNTSLHLAEYRADYPKQFESQGSAVMQDGKRQWVNYEILSIDSDDFDAVGQAYEEAISYVPGKICLATTRLLRQRPLVDFAVQWFSENRPTSA